MVSFKFKLSVGLVILATLSGCFHYELTPFATEVPENLRNSTTKNLSQLHKRSPGSEQKIAFMADTHNYYQSTNTVVQNLNRLALDFVVIAGDITEVGLLREYLWAHEVFAKLNFPWFTAIGNHDLLSSGKTIYQRLFGPLNYSFLYGDAKYVIFNNNELESSPDVLDYQWLEAQLANREGKTYLFVIAHIPPFADTEFRDLTTFSTLLRHYRVDGAFYGHLHNFAAPQWHNSTCSVVIGSPIKGEYGIFTVSNQGLKYVAYRNNQIIYQNWCS